MLLWAHPRSSSCSVTFYHVLHLDGSEDAVRISVLQS